MGLSLSIYNRSSHCQLSDTCIEYIGEKWNVENFGKGEVKFFSTFIQYSMGLLFLGQHWQETTGGGEIAELFCQSICLWWAPWRECSWRIEEYHRHRCVRLINLERVTCILVSHAQQFHWWYHSKSTGIPNPFTIVIIARYKNKLGVVAQPMGMIT